MRPAAEATYTEEGPKASTPFRVLLVGLDMADQVSPSHFSTVPLLPTA